MVRPEGRPLGAELLVRAGSHGAARTEWGRQDDADAVDDGTGAGQPGRDPRRRAEPAARDRRVHGRVALVPEDEAVPAALTARQFVRYVADLHRVRAPRGPRRRVGDGRAARRRGSARRRLQQGDAAAHEDRRRPGDRATGDGPRRTLERRRPGPAPPPHRSLQAARPARPHRDRQLPRAERGRTVGGTGDRVDPRPPRRGRRPSGDPRRHG